MVKQGKNTKKYFVTFKIIPCVIKKLSTFHVIKSFTQGSFEKIMKKFLINSKEISENL